MLPVIEKFMAAHRLPDVTVVADTGMMSEATSRPPRSRHRLADSQTSESAHGNSSSINSYAWWSWGAD